MKPAIPLNKLRFVPCVRGSGMLQAFVEVAGRNFAFVPMKKMNLIRRGICRGKISQRNNQTHLEERTPPAPNQ